MMLALPAVLVSLKVIRKPALLTMVELPALEELKKIRIAVPLLVIFALPASLELLNCTDPLLAMVESPAVAVLLKVIVPRVALVILALSAEAESKKSSSALLVICEVPAVLVLLN